MKLILLLWNNQALEVCLKVNLVFKHSGLERLNTKLKQKVVSVKLAAFSRLLMRDSYIFCINITF